MDYVYKLGVNYLVFLVCFVSVNSAFNPCQESSYKFFFSGNFGSRNAHCGIGDVHSRLCDYYLLEHWYYVKEGTIINHCPTGDCGVTYPIWMNGSFPEENEGIVNKTACVRKGTDCCGDTLTIQVKNCSTFLVYYFERPKECSSAYCFASALPCEDVEETHKTMKNESLGEHSDESYADLHEVVDTRDTVIVASMVSLLVGCGVTIAVIFIILKFKASRGVESNDTKETRKQYENAGVYSCTPLYEDIYSHQEKCKINTFI